MALNSIRWRLPLTYALIALLAALLLGAVLLTTLQTYYSAQEVGIMRREAINISRMAGLLLSDDTPKAALQAQFEGFSFLSQSRVRLLDSQLHVIVDSGLPENRSVQVSSIRLDEAWERVLEAPFPPGGYASMIFVRGDAPGESAPVVGDSPDMLPPLEEVQDVSAAVVAYPPDAPALPVDDANLGLLSLFEFAVREVSQTVPAPGDRLFIGGEQRDVLMGSPPFGFSLFESPSDARRRSNQSLVLPVRSDTGDTLGFVEVSAGPAYGSAIVDSVLQGWLLASAVAVFGAALAGWFVSRTISQPLVGLTRVTADMAQGNLGVRADDSRDDEFGVLGRSFNDMAGRIEDTIVTLRRFVADAAHELHTPLTALHANLELAVSEEDASKRQTFIQRAQEQVKRLEAMTISLLDLSRIEMKLTTEDWQEVNLVQLILETSEMYASRAEQAGIDLAFELPSQPIFAAINEAQMRRAVGNLLDNAIKFTPEFGTIRIGVMQERGNIALWVKDTGIGIPQEDIPYLFNRFHRARNAAAYPGSGLGLAIIKAIAESHRGRVAVESSTGGTQVSLELPVMSI